MNIKDKILLTKVVALFALIWAGIVVFVVNTPEAQTATTCSAGLNACLGMYGDARYEHISVPGGIEVELSGNSNEELTGFFYDGYEAFIQPWCLIFHDDYGYSSKSYSSPVSYNEENPDGAYNRVDVNLSTQKAKYYDWNGIVYWRADICSGRDGKETPTGWFKLVYQKTDTNLEGEVDGTPYSSHVDYWMVFKRWYDENGEVSSEAGFHDTDWKYVYSGLNKTYGSLGCINLNKSDAASLYEIFTENDPDIYIHY